MDVRAGERSEARDGGQTIFTGSPAFRRRRRSNSLSDGHDEEGLPQRWTLLPEDLELIGKARGDHNRLALALLLASARAERRLISDPATLPPAVVPFVAAQLGVDPGVLADYRKRPATRSQHVAWICAHLGLRPFGRADEERLVAFIGEKVAHTANSAALLDAGRGLAGPRGPAATGGRDDDRATRLRGAGSRRRAAVRLHRRLPLGGGKGPPRRHLRHRRGRERPGAPP